MYLLLIFLSAYFAEIQNQPTMSHLLTVIFGKDRIEELLSLKPDKIVVTTTLEEAVLKDGSNAGVVQVTAFAMRAGSDEPLGSVGGCPMPPCS
ncbi:MAG TPA: hypothetical protein VF609_08820 [Flavisolibacter sp.]